MHLQKFNKQGFSIIITTKTLNQTLGLYKGIKQRGGELRLNGDAVYNNFHMFFQRPLFLSYTQGINVNL